jgi:pimeloyl-ACP methyl ester carboxylesterase
VPEVRIGLPSEARAVLRVAALLPRDLDQDFPSTVGMGEHVAVFVHGLLATAGVMRPLREHVGLLDGVRTAAFTYPPGMGVAAVAEELQGLMSRLPREAPIHLVGHSMGGLCVRWLVQELRSDRRVVQTVSIAAPFQGARGARLMPGQAGRDLRAGSQVLARLGASAAKGDVPHLSVFGALDSAVPESTTLGFGERLVVPGCGHNALLFHPDVLSAVRGRVDDAMAR